MTRRLRVGIITGGRSAEHEVSISSAESILRAVDRDRYEPYLVYIDPQGRWRLPAGPAPLVVGPGLAAQLGASTPAASWARLAGESRALAVPDEPGQAVQARTAVRALAETIDVAFLAIHGPYGEDGTLQGFLELAGIPYTGAGVLASALAMDKVVFKDLMRGHDLPVVAYRWFRRTEWQADADAVTQAVRRVFPERCVVKPARLGSSVGMSLVHAPPEVADALALAFSWDAKVIVEEYVTGARELECGVLGNDQPVVFAPGEVRSHHEYYDYESKYVEGLADVLPRAEVGPSLAARLMDMALRAYRAVDAAGMARVDFLVPPDAIYVSEMNTIPGFTATSMFPKQAELAGIGYRDLVTRLIELGLEASHAGRGPSPPNEVAT